MISPSGKIDMTAPVKRNETLRKYLHHAKYQKLTEQDTKASTLRHKSARSIVSSKPYSPEI